jgi:hypothetical protein
MSFMGGSLTLLGFRGVMCMARQNPTRMTGLATLGLAGALLTAVAGCGQSETYVPVEGQVKAAGKPLAKGAIILYPDASKGNTTKQEPRGSIEADGRYKIVTHPHEGAPPGWYKVAVIATEPSDPKNPYSVPRSLIPEKFGKPDESRLTLEVRKEAPPGAYDLDLK